MWVTAYVDASFKDKQASWAIWLRCERGRHIEAGTFQAQDSTVAELHAITVGFATAVERWGPLGVLIKSDSKGAIELADIQRKLHKRNDIRELQLIIRQTRENAALRLVHVRGHQKNNGTQAYLNSQVDRLASQARKNKP